MIRNEIKIHRKSKHPADISQKPSFSYRYQAPPSRRKKKIGRRNLSTPQTRVISPILRSRSTRGRGWRRGDGSSYRGVNHRPSPGLKHPETRICSQSKLRRVASERERERESKVLRLLPSGETEKVLMDRRRRRRRE